MNQWDEFVPITSAILSFSYSFRARVWVHNLISRETSTDNPFLLLTPSIVLPEPIQGGQLNPPTLQLGLFIIEHTSPCLKTKWFANIDNILGTYDGQKYSLDTQRVCSLKKIVKIKNGLGFKRKTQHCKWNVNPSTVDYARNGLFIPPSLHSNITASFYDHTWFGHFNKVAC